MQGRSAHRRGWLLVALLAVTGLLVPTAAAASPTEHSLLQADNLLLYRGDQAATKTLAKLRSLGVDTVRVSVRWNDFAPSPKAHHRPRGFTHPRDPAAYRRKPFATYDHLVRQATKDGIAVLFNVTGPAPLWATGRRPGHRRKGGFKPHARAFGDFVAMLGRRYDGTYQPTGADSPLPRVSIWSIWNEPNRGGYILPQSVRRHHHWVTASAFLYRRLVRTAGRALAATGHGTDHDTILMGETQPTGRRRRGRRAAVRPAIFLRALLCITRHGHPLGRRAARLQHCDYRKRGPLPVNGFANHPYSIISYPTVPGGRGDFTLGDGHRLEHVLDQGGKVGHIPAFLPVWYTEYGYQTNPPDPTKRGISLGDQARWLSVAQQVTMRDPRIAAMAQFELRDSGPDTKFPPGSHRYWSTYQSGLEFADGRPKPSQGAYRLPFVVHSRAPAGGQMEVWGYVRPAPPASPQHVQLQFRPQGTADWRDVDGPITTDGNGVFDTKVPAMTSGDWRFTWQTPGTPGTLPGGLGAVSLPPLGIHAAKPGTVYTSQALPVTVTGG